MATNSKIEWTHHTFNPWRGCTKVSDGCANCYADALSKRNPKVLGIWGPNGTREIAAEAQWRKPIKWNAEAEKAGERHRVFCASLADVFEADDTMPEASRCAVWQARVRLFQLILATPHLDWLLLTKRPENIRPVLKEALEQASMWDPVSFPEMDKVAEWLHSWLDGSPPANVWLGASAENQPELDKRARELLKVDAVVHFVSAEPLLGDLDLRDWLHTVHTDQLGTDWRGPHGPWVDGISWVIVGGESGAKARPMHPEWVRSIRDQCEAAGVPFFFKQWGECVPYETSAQEPFLEGQNGDCFDTHLFPDDLCDHDGEFHKGWMTDVSGVFTQPPSDVVWHRRVGKKAAGRKLDGVEHNAVPEVKR